jgi:hypothetical protein
MSWKLPVAEPEMNNGELNKLNGSQTGGSGLR